VKISCFLTGGITGKVDVAVQAELPSTLVKHSRLLASESFG